MEWKEQEMGHDAVPFGPYVHEIRAGFGELRDLVLGDVQGGVHRHELVHRAHLLELGRFHEVGAAHAGFNIETDGLRGMYFQGVETGRFHSTHGVNRVL